MSASKSASLEQWETQGDKGHSCVCPLDTQRHHFSISSSPHYHEFSGVGEISILLLSKISAREQTTLSQIPKSCSSGAEKKVKHELGHRIPMNHNLTCFISTCSSLYLIGRKILGHLFLNWSMWLSRRCMRWVMGVVHKQNMTSEIFEPLF